MARISQRLYEKVARRAKYRCEYCGLPQAAEALDLTIDHVTPQGEGGRTQLSNLALACPACNSRKWKFTHWYDSLDPEKKRDVPLFNPRRHRWPVHFAWDPSDPAKVMGKTATGRATIELLAMNTMRAVEIRRWLITVQRHPPDDQ